MIANVVGVRLWSLHPQYFDRQALTACWREALLAQAVLRGATLGYRHHPQLERFRECASPTVAIAAYLGGIADEADARHYRFDRTKIAASGDTALRISVTSGQLAYEWSHLSSKLARRSPEIAAKWAELAAPLPHPLFTVTEGAIAAWERPLG